MKILTFSYSRLLKFALIFLVSHISFLFSADAEENYVFERMWPTLQQPWYFTYPEDIATDSTGNVYVADTLNHRIQKFTSNGQFLTSWGKAGSGDGEFSGPSGVQVDNYGDVYVVDRANNRIQKFTSNGQFLRKWGTQGSADGQFDFKFYIRLAFDNSGNVYVVDDGNHRIQKFDSGGRFLDKWGTEGGGNGEFYYPCSIAIDNNGYIYIADSYNRIQKFDAAGQFVGQWGGTGTDNNGSGSGDGEFNRPYDIDIDSKGHVYVVEQDNHRIQKFTPAGVFVDKWGVQGRADGQFWHPTGFAIDKNDSFYVADTFNNRIQKLTADGHFLSKWNSGGNGQGNFDRPRGITVDNGGNVYVSEAFGNRIQKFTPEGQLIGSWGTEGSGEGELKWPYGMAVDNNGFLYVAEASNDRIQKFTSDGQYVKQWGGEGRGDGYFILPVDVAVDHDGFIYVVEFFGYRIQKFTADGQFVTKWGTEGNEDGQFVCPAGITIDSNGFVYVVDASNNRIQKFTSDGQFIAKWGSGGTAEGQFNDPRSIVVDSDDYVYVGDTGNDRVQKFTSDGQFVAKWGGSGNYPGQMRSPWVAVGLDGKVFVAESSNNRIQVFRKITSGSNNRAIIIAGGGPYPGNNLWNATEMSANFAYRSLAFQGFTKENIHYLSSDTALDLDNNGEPDDVDAEATNANLQQVLASDWALAADSLLVYLVDHGGAGTFRMSGTETLSVSELDSWLDQLQQTISGRVIVIYDACESGSFLDALTPLSGKERIVITTTSPGENAQFVTQGSVSFSNFFWTHIFNGEDIKSAFLLAENAIKYSTDLQNPLIDADGDGNSNEPEDTALVEGLYIGNGTFIQGDAPVIGSVNDPQAINGSSSAVLSAFDVTDDDGIARVWAVVRPPNYSQSNTANPVQDLPSIDLLPVGNDRYDGTYSDFNIEGTYQIAVYARDRVGNTSIPKLTTVSVNNPLRRKAIIVAGGSQTDDSWETIEKSVKLAYETISFQGYADEDIYLLSPTSIPGVTKLPLVNALSNLDHAVNIWAAENALDLVIYLVGTGGIGTFQLNTAEKLFASDLRTLLENLQSVMPGKVTLIYDAAYSGSFLPLLTPDQNSERILISSTTNSQPANFFSTGDISFSKFFWRRVLNGMNLWDAFVHAKNAMQYCSGQTPQLDDNGNGIGNEKSDGLLARKYAIGVGIMLAGDDPLIGSVSPDQTLGGVSTATVWADNITTTGTINRVWAVVSPPTHAAATTAASQAVDLLDIDGDGRYEGTIDDIVLYGNYTVAIYAMDSVGNVSLPVVTHVQQTTGPDAFENDDNAATAGVLILNATETRTHTLHDAGDADWVKFFAIAGQSYEIEINNPGANCDAVITLYDSTGSNALLTVDDGWHGEREFASWSCEASGLYYIKVTQANPNDYGADTAYDLIVYRPVAPVSAWFVGTITNAISGAPIGDAIVQTSNLGSAISLPGSGNYSMIQDLSSESETLTVVADGYQMYSEGITIVAEGTTLLNIEMSPINYAVPWSPSFNSPTHIPSQLSTSDNVAITWDPMVPTDGAISDSYTYVWDNSSSTDIPPTKTPTEAFSGNISGLTINRTLSSGTWYLHMRAVDSSGNWTMTHHFGPIVIDTEPAPTITAITPTSGVNSSGSSIVTITGNHFTRIDGSHFSSVTAKIGNTPLTEVDVTSSTSITAIYDIKDQTAETKNVTVTTDWGTSEPLADGFTVTNPAPTVSTISPDSVINSVENEVSITGNGFLSTTSTPAGTASPTVQLKQGATTVSITNVTWISKTFLTATVQSGKNPGTYDVVVTNCDGQAGTLSNGFEITLPAPYITALSPSSITNDSPATITLSGANFATSGVAPQVLLEAEGKYPIACTSEAVTDATTMTAVVPADPDVTGVYSVKVTNPDGQTATRIDAFTISNPAPAVTSITPSSMINTGTQSVTVVGTRFRSGIKVWIDTTECTGVVLDSQSPTTELTCTVPAGIAPGTYDVILKNEGVTTTGALINSFMVNDPITTAAIVYNAADPTKVTAGDLTITAIFTLSQSTAPKISIDQQGSLDIIDADMAATSDGKVWVFTYTVNASDGSNYLDGDANVIIRKNSQTVTITSGSKFTIATDTTGNHIPGDLNADGVIGLEDAILAVQAMVGIDISGSVPAGYTAAGVDVNGDGKIGLAEAVYILQTLAFGSVAP